MKLQSETSSIAITAYGPHWIQVGTQRVTHNAIIDHEGGVQAWECTDFNDLNAHHFEILLTRQPELVLLGTGKLIQFPKPQIIRPLIEACIGVESMDTPSACRTFNILASEGRRVIAALLV